MSSRVLPACAAPTKARASTAATACLSMNHSPAYGCNAGIVPSRSGPAYRANTDAGIVPATTQLAQAAQQRCGGGVQPRGIPSGKARQQVVAQCLAQPHAPLVEAVDAPHGATGEHPVLIQGYQRTQAARCQRIQHQRRAWSVA